MSDTEQPDTEFNPLDHAIEVVEREDGLHIDSDQAHEVVDSIRRGMGNFEEGFCEGFKVFEADAEAAIRLGGAQLFGTEPNQLDEYLDIFFPGE